MFDSDRRGRATHCRSFAARELRRHPVKALGSAVPSERAGIAFGHASTTLFIEILVSLAGMGAILASHATGRIWRSARDARLDSSEARETLHAAALSAVAVGVAAASLLAAAVALLTAPLTVSLDSAADSAPLRAAKRLQCKFVDCWDPR
jgi:hypothetical protein